MGRVEINDHIFLFALTIKGKKVYYLITPIVEEDNY